ncbi:hypothetical protein GCM10022222_38600 [Amycolatopsis ultiminotia]|uniref:Uncharacterized protein n=1 Tax=Amycolatopsis ultiminotia TaxID=543629 RepID=A0ABP6WJB3_9PSEU
MADARFRARAAAPCISRRALSNVGNAVRLAQEGADVIAIDISAQSKELEDTARPVRATGQRIVAELSDIRDIEAMSAIVRTGVAQLGHLDVVCANAGITGTAQRQSTDLATRLRTFREVVDINLTGTFCTIEVSKPWLLASNRGGSVIINFLAGLRAGRRLHGVQARTVRAKGCLVTRCRAGGAGS